MREESDSSYSSSESKACVAAGIEPQSIPATLSLDQQHHWDRESNFLCFRVYLNLGTLGGMGWKMKVWNPSIAQKSFWRSFNSGINHTAFHFSLLSGRGWTPSRLSKNWSLGQKKKAQNLWKLVVSPRALIWRHLGPFWGARQGGREKEEEKKPQTKSAKGIYIYPGSDKSCEDLNFIQKYPNTCSLVLEDQHMRTTVVFSHGNQWLGARL